MTRRAGIAGAAVAAWWLFFVAPSAFAASLFFTPNSFEKNTGDQFFVSIYVASPDQAINAVSGTISFPADKLEVTELVKTGSILSLWVREPSFSNTAGTVQFEGIVLNPGFQGAQAKVLTIHFRTKSSGTASLNFSSSSVLANDGQGTNVIRSVGTSNGTIEVPVTTPPARNATTPPPSQSPGRPFASKVSSATHPDSTMWYAHADPVFTWEIPDGTTGVSIGFNEKPTADPGTVSDGLIAKKEYHAVSDGVWFFHLRLRNREGWGAVTHFGVQIDTTRPEPFSLAFPAGKETTSATLPVVFGTTDATSGIAFYRVKVGDGEAIEVQPEKVSGGAPFILATADPGKRTVIVQAVDHAGNITTAADEILVRPLDPPVITGYSKTIIQGEVLQLFGTTYANATVTIRITAESGSPKNEEVKSDATGHFTIVWPERPKNGIYRVSARVTDARGAKSLFSDPITISVRERAVMRIGTIVIDYISVVTSLLGVVLVLIILTGLVWYRLMRLRKRLQKEVRDVDEVMHATFDSVSVEIEKHIRALERAGNARTLTVDEERLLRQLRSMLQIGEARIDEKINKVVKPPRVRRTVKKRPPLDT